jgi:hypothetical protein
MSDPYSRIEYMSEELIFPSPSPVSADMNDSAPLPMERLEARICELAGHLAAATCQYLLLVADLDNRRGWADWEMPSCAAWLSWKCQIASGTTREHVRVARALGSFPAITAEFAAGRLSYAKVRALSRIATPETEQDLLQMATPMTASQLERFARAHRRVTRNEEGEIIHGQKLTWRHDGDKAFSLNAHLSPIGGAVVLQAIRAALNDLEHPHDDHHDDSASAETRAGTLKNKDKQDGLDLEGEAWPSRRMEDPRNLADALVAICVDYLQGKIASADNPDLYQVIIHAGAQAIIEGQDPAEAGPTQPEPAEVTGPARVSAETRSAPAAAPAVLRGSHPAYLLRCHTESGLAIPVAVLRLIGCNAAISAMVHDADGAVLAVGRRTRKPSPALRRALRERDGYRCRFPGCESRRTDAHHIMYWANGGETTLGNLISLCKRHHMLVHDKGYVIAAVGTGFAFYTPRGVPLPASPPLPATTGDITTSHDAAITPGTIIPPHSGERLDLHLAIWTCFSNARRNSERRQREQQAQTQAA